MLEKMKLSTKLGLGFGLLLFALVIVGAIGLFKVASVGVVVADLSSVHVPLLEAAAQIDQLTTEQELMTTKYAHHGDEAFVSRFWQMNALVNKNIDKVRKLVMSEPELVQRGWLKAIEPIDSQHDVFVATCKKLMDTVKKGENGEALDMLAKDVTAQSATLKGHVDHFCDMNRKEAFAVAAAAEAEGSSARRIIGSVSATALLVGIVLALFLSRSISGPVKKTIQGLVKGSGEVQSVAEQVSSGSQSLAEGASEQAASIEETSASLEQMAAMTKQNSGHAVEANRLMHAAVQVVDEANESMSRLTGSMVEISKASEETSRIIKTIDEIAFQTNLLALNAAVEAARAGEAGAGFAVVADEVRNLAMRAAEAARDTAGLIEGTVKKVADGSQLVERTNGAFAEVAKSVSRVGELLDEISSASEEQTRGVDQINVAVSEMERVIQATAANAEESAAAAEQLSSQAEEMNRSVQDLMALVGGSTPRARTTSLLARLRRKSRQPSRSSGIDSEYSGKFARNPVGSPEAGDFQDF